MTLPFVRFSLLCYLIALLINPAISFACGNDGATASQFPVSGADPDIIRSLLGWGNPVALDSTVNDSSENCRPSISYSGDTLYFQDERE